MRKTLCILLLFLFSFKLSAQEKELNLTLSDCIRIATDSTIAAFRAKSAYLYSYWEYRTYKAQRLPLINLSLTPIHYNSHFVKRYDFNENVDIYRQNQSINSSAGISIYQNFDLTGGTFILETDLSFARTFGGNVHNQYSSVPIRLGYSQSLLGFNPFKWEKKMAPLKYEKSRRQLLYQKEEIAETAVNYFFILAKALTEYNMAIGNRLIHYF